MLNEDYLQTPPFLWEFKAEGRLLIRCLPHTRSLRIGSPPLSSYLVSLLEHPVLQEHNSATFSSGFSTGSPTCGPWPVTGPWHIGHWATYVAGQCVRVCTRTAVFVRRHEHCRHFRPASRECRHKRCRCSQLHSREQWVFVRMHVCAHAFTPPTHTHKTIPSFLPLPHSGCRTLI